MCLRRTLWTHLLIAAIAAQLAVVATATTTAAVSTTEKKTSYKSTTTQPTTKTTIVQKQWHRQEAKHADAVQLHRSSHDSIMSCLGDCATSKCRDDCFLNDMSDEEIVRRTQRCTESCKDEPEELVQMCIQKCSYYLMDPVGHDLDEQSITDSRGLLPDTPHVRTRIRLIGPDGLPIISTVEDAAETATPTNSEDSANTTSSTWTPVYRVHIISGAGERLYIWWGYYLVLVICLVLHLE